MVMIAGSIPYSGKKEDEIVPYITIFWVGVFVEMGGMYPLEALSKIRVQVKSYVLRIIAAPISFPLDSFTTVEIVLK
jgi:hypothetical protein